MLSQDVLYFLFVAVVVSYFLLLTRLYVASVAFRCLVLQARQAYLVMSIMPWSNKKVTMMFGHKVPCNFSFYLNLYACECLKIATKPVLN